MMRRVFCLLLCAVLILGMTAGARAAQAQEEELLEVSVTTYSNRTSPSVFDIAGLYRDNVFYIDPQTIVELTDGEIYESTAEQVIFQFHGDIRVITVTADEKLTEEQYGKRNVIDIPTVSYHNQLYISAPDFLRYVGATVCFGADENAQIHMSVSMPYTVMDLYWDYYRTDGYAFNWAEAKNELIDAGDQLIFSYFSTMLFSYDANLLMYAIPQFADSVVQEEMRDSLLCIMNTEGIELLDSYHESISLFGELGGAYDYSMFAIQQIYDNVKLDGLDQAIMKAYGLSFSTIDTVVEVTDDYLTALDTARQFYYMSENNKQLLKMTLSRANANPQLYDQCPNLFQAVSDAAAMIESEYAAQEQAAKDGILNLVSSAAGTVLGELNPLVKAFDFAADVTMLLPEVADYAEDDARITHTRDCDTVNYFARCMLAKDSNLLAQLHLYLGEDDTLIQEQMKADMILSLKASLAARQLMLNCKTGWLTEDSKEYMTAMAKYTAELLDKARTAVAVPIGLARETDEDITWIRFLANVGRMGNVVSVGGNTYYWRYDAASFYETGYSSFSHQKELNQLICRDKDGKEKVVREDYAYGKIAVTNDWIIYNDYGGGINMQSTDGKRSMAFGYRFLCISSNGAYLLYSEADGTVYELSLRTMEKGWLGKNIQFISEHNGRIYYSQNPTDDLGTIRVCSTVLGGPSILHLYESDTPLYDMDVGYSGASVAQICFTDEYIYFSYGSLAGSGIFFQGGRVVRVKYDGTDVRVVAGNSELVGSEFTVSADGTVTTTENNSEPLFSYLKNYRTENGTIYSIDQTSGYPFPMLLPADYSMLGSALAGVYDENNGIVFVDFMEIVDNKVYCLLHHAVEVDEDNYGSWRDAYQREKTVFLMKDMSTGQVTVIYTID